MTQEVDIARIYNFTRGRTSECTDLAATCVIASLNICVRWHSECRLDTFPSAENLKANSGGDRVSYKLWNRNTAKGQTPGEERAATVTEQGLAEGNSARLLGKQLYGQMNAGRHQAHGKGARTRP
jgi:hypothetical protein